MLVAYHLLYPVFVMQVMCFALLAVAFNLLLGHVGLLSLGHAAFFGTGAYVAGYAAKVWGFTAEGALALAVLASVLLGIAIGGLALRRSGIHFAMITLALAQVLYFIIFQTRALGGENGLQGIPRPRLLGLIDISDNGAMYVFVSAVTGAAVWAIWRIGRSPFGVTLSAIRQNEARMIALGYNVQQIKLAAFALSAGFAGLAGALKVMVVQLASLTDASFFISGEAVLMALLGGMAFFAGPLIGAVVVISLQLALVASPVPVPMILGALFVAVTLFFPRGIAGMIARR
nr:branched-chain amino acid ABC transporter permease [Szabonella alba]